MRESKFYFCCRADTLNKLSTSQKITSNGFTEPHFHLLTTLNTVIKVKLVKEPMKNIEKE